jgi:uncharacterized peroxidase-related enzyme
MRLEILNTGYSFGAKILFRIVRLFSGYPMPDAARLVFYRPDFYGNPMKKFTHQAMRGPSSWSVGDRELMAAYISKLNQCTFCIGAHVAVATGAYSDKTKVEMSLANFETAPIDEPLRVTMRMLEKLTKEHSIDQDDIRKVLASGVSPMQVENALAVCFAFNTTNRLADTFEFFVPNPQAMQAGAKYLLKRGYQ